MIRRLLCLLFGHKPDHIDGHIDLAKGFMTIVGRPPERPKIGRIDLCVRCRTLFYERTKA